MYLTSKWNPSIEPSGVCKVIRSLISDQWGTKDLTSFRPSQQKVQRISPSADLTRIFGVRNHSALSGFSEKCPSLMVWFAFPLLLLFYFNHVQRICAIYCHFSMTVGGINSEAVPASKTTQILFMKPLDCCCKGNQMFMMFISSIIRQIMWKITCTNPHESS